MKKIFITGGNGYVGRNVARYFADKGYSIVAMIRNVNSYNEKLEHPYIQVVLGDILQENLHHLMDGCDILIHTAADVDHTNQSKTQYTTNVDGTQNILSAAQRAGITNFIHLSTESVLATGSDLINVNESQKIPKVHVGNYSYSKAIAEKVVSSFASSNFRVIIIRPRMVWGRDDTTALPQLINAAKSKQLAWIDGGEYLTSTTHIINLCHGIEQALIYGKSKEIYDITDGNPIIFREFVTALLNTQNVSIPTKEISRKLLKNIAKISDFLHKISNGLIKGPITFQQYAASAVEITLDITKAQKELSYSPIITREQGLIEIQT